jgi:predicted nucleic acid-binding protein
VNTWIDTNIALYLLGRDKKLADLLDDIVIHLSFVSELELLSYPDLSVNDQKEIAKFIDECVVIDINHRIKKKTISIRKVAKLKLPDAIIAATAISEQLSFISADKDFERVDNLQLFSYEI